MPDGSSFPTPTARKRPAALSPAPAPTTPLVYAVPGFSIELLGRQLAVAEHADNLLSDFGMVIGREAPRDLPLNQRRLQQRHTSNAETSLDRHTAALRELILASRPETLVDALVTVMVAANFVRMLEDNAYTEKEVGEIAEKARRALYNAVRAIAPVAGVTLAEVGGSSEVGVWCDPWPLIDTGNVAPADGPECHSNSVALDGSTYQGAAA